MLVYFYSVYVITPIYQISVDCEITWTARRPLSKLTKCRATTKKWDKRCQMTHKNVFFVWYRFKPHLSGLILSKKDETGIFRKHVNCKLFDADFFILSTLSHILSVDNLNYELLMLKLRFVLTIRKTWKFWLLTNTC